MNASETCKAELKEKTIVSEIIDYMDMLAEEAQKIAERAEDKMYPVMNKPVPEPDGDKKKAQREFPPLFDDMRDKLHTIEYSLRKLNDVLNRTEL